MKNEDSVSRITTTYLNALKSLRIACIAIVGGPGEQGLVVSSNIRDVDVKRILQGIVDGFDEAKSEDL